MLHRMAEENHPAVTDVHLYLNHVQVFDRGYWKLLAHPTSISLSFIYDFNIM